MSTVGIKQWMLGMGRFGSGLRILGVGWNWGGSWSSKDGLFLSFRENLRTYPIPPLPPPPPPTAITASHHSSGFYASASFSTSSSMCSGVVHAFKSPRQWSDHAHSPGIPILSQDVWCQSGWRRRFDSAVDCPSSPAFWASQVHPVPVPVPGCHIPVWWWTSFLFWFS